MNKDNNSDYILLLLFYKKCYSLYNDKTVDEKNQQAEACCVWRAKMIAAKISARQFILQMYGATNGSPRVPTWLTHVYEVSA